MNTLPASHTEGGLLNNLSMIQRFDYENVFSQEAPKRDIAQKEIRMIQMVHNYARVLEATKGKILSLDLIRTLEQLINRYHSNSPRMTLDVKEEVIDGIYMSFFPKRPMGGFATYWRNHYRNKIRKGLSKEISDKRFEQLEQKNRYHGFYYLDPMAMGCYDLFAEHGEMLPKDINDIMLRYDATDEQIKRSLRREQYQEEKQFTEFSINRLGAMASRIIWDEKGYPVIRVGEDHGRDGYYRVLGPVTNPDGTVIKEELERWFGDDYFTIKGRGGKLLSKTNELIAAVFSSVPEQFRKHTPQAQQAIKASCPKRENVITGNYRIGEQLSNFPMPVASNNMASGRVFDEYAAGKADTNDLLPLLLGTGYRNPNKDRPNTGWGTYPMSDYGPGGNDWFWARAPTLHQCLLKQKLNEKYLIEKKPSQEPTDNQIRNSKSSNGIGMLLFEKLTINEVKALQIGSTKVSKQ